MRQPPTNDALGVDGLVGMALHQVVVANPTPGPSARVAAVGRYLARRHPWRMPGELVLQDGFPIIVGLGERLRTEEPWVLDGDRPDVVDTPTWVPLTGSCMGRVFVDRAVVLPGREPRVGEAVAVRWRQPELGDFAKWLFAPIPPRERWAELPDAVLVWGSEEFPDVVFASPLAAIWRIDSVIPWSMRNVLEQRLPDTFAPELAELAAH